MLNATHDGYGGLEHCNSTALICSRADLPRTGVDKASDGYIQLPGLISHEYFHTWNVKRLRPAELVPYNYDQENYTELLWFFEGFTSYYDDLLLRRAGLIDNAAYLKLITKTLNQVQQTPGRKVQSVAQSSFDAWVRVLPPGRKHRQRHRQLLHQGRTGSACAWISNCAAKGRPRWMPSCAACGSAAKVRP